MEEASQHATWKKYKCMHAAVHRMSVKEKRRIFSLIRNPSCTHDTVVLSYGMTIGDICCMNILSDANTRA